MKPPVAVVDTNVVVSGLLTRDPGAPTVTILNAMVEGSIRFLLSVELIAEYREVLLRPKIRDRHGLQDEEVDTILQTIALHGMLRSISTDADRGPDPGDAHLWALLDTSPGAVLVTGDRALIDAAPQEASVLAPREFAELAANETRS